MHAFKFTLRNSISYEGRLAIVPHIAKKLIPIKRR